MTPVYPGSVVTDARLKKASNRVFTTLRGAISAADTVATVADPTRIEVEMLLTVDAEVMSVTAISGNNLTVVRGFDGTTAAAHSSGRTVAANWTGWHHNAMAAEVKAIEQALGAGLSNVTAGGAVNSASYNFAAQSPGGSLTANIINSVTLTPVPSGVNATDIQHYLYISGGVGAAEAVLITGGTAVSGAASGTVTFTPLNNHSGAWTIASATAGIREAIAATITAAGRGSVLAPAGLHIMRGPLYIPAVHDFKLQVDGGLEFASSVGANDGLMIDSAQWSTFEFNGLILYKGSGHAVRLRPERPNLNTNVRGVIENQFRFVGITSHPEGGAWQTGVPIAQSNLYLCGDSTTAAQGNVAHNAISIAAMYGALNGVLVDSLPDGLNDRASVQENIVSIANLNGFTQKGIRTAKGVNVGGQVQLCTNGQWYVTVIFGRDDGTGTNPQTGIDMAKGTLNNYFVTTALSQPSGKSSIVWAAEFCSGNDVVVQSMGGTVNDLVDDTALNRMRVMGPTAALGITPGASPWVLRNLTARPVKLIVSGGTVSDIQLSHTGSPFFTTGEIAGVFPLDVGEYIRITYSVAPTVTRFSK